MTPSATEIELRPTADDHRVARHAAAAIVLTVAEAAIPLPLPGVKPGLANIVTLVVLVPLVLGLTISLIGIAPALRYLPDLAGIQLLTAYPGVGLLDPIPGGLIMTAWALAFITISAAVFIARDSG